MVTTALTEPKKTTEPVGATEARVNWGQVGCFIGLTFGLTWLLDLVLWRTVGYRVSPVLGILMQLQMLLPAFSAIVLGTFFFKSSPIYIQNRLGKARWFFYFFIVYTLVYISISVLCLVSPTQVATAATVVQAVTVLGLLLLVILRLLSGREAFAQAGLAGGKLKYWLLFGAGMALFYLSQTLLNYLFGLGQAVDLVALMKSVAPSGADQAIQMARTAPVAFLVISGLQSAFLSPLIALLITFGEEYGWRGYLQGELIKLGRVKGILLLGLIWGVWHAPVIMMGHNYPGYPIAGVFMMIAYCIGLAFVLGYAVLKSGSVWLAAFLHGVNNQSFSFLAMMVYAPANAIFSFGIGLYGLACMAIIVLLLLRDPIWQER